MTIDTAVILAGGKGTRLYPVTKGSIPKALVKVKNKSLLDYVIETFTSSGIKRIVISAGHLYQKIASHLAERDYGTDVKLVVEDFPLGTAGAIRYAVEKTGIEGDFFLTNADTLTTVDLDQMQQFYQGTPGLALMALVPSSDLRNRVVMLDEENRVLATKLYPTPDELEGWTRIGSDFFVNAGVYLLNSECFKCIPPKRLTPINDLINKLVSNGKLYAFLTNAQYFNVGTPSDLDLAEKFWQPRS